MLIGSSEILSDYLSAIYNHSKMDNCYPSLLKYATIMIEFNRFGQKLGFGHFYFT